MFTAESRALQVKMRHDEVDQLGCWSDVVKYCFKFSPDLVINQEADIIRSYKLIGIPPEVEVSIVINCDLLLKPIAEEI